MYAMLEQSTKHCRQHSNINHNSSMDVWENDHKHGRFPVPEPSESQCGNNSGFRDIPTTKWRCVHITAMAWQTFWLITYLLQVVFIAKGSMIKHIIFTVGHVLADDMLSLNLQYNV